MVPLADPEIAAALFRKHLDDLWRSRCFRDLKSGCLFVDDLHVIVPILGRNAERSDYYFFRLGAEYYDAGPPTVDLVVPDTWDYARAGTRWFPKISNLDNFRIHDQYQIDGVQRQLVCFSFSAGYYQSNHSPTEAQRWEKGRHTVSATIHRLAEVFANHYEGPNG